MPHQQHHLHTLQRVPAQCRTQHETAPPAALHCGFFKDASRGSMLHLEVRPVCRPGPQNGVEEEEKRSCPSLVVHDR